MPRKRAKKPQQTEAPPPEKKTEKTVPYTATGVLDSQELSRDVKISSFSVNLAGTDLLKDTTLSLNLGARYGLIGSNGSGKTTILKALGDRMVPIPAHMDIHHLAGEVDATEITAINCVIGDLAAEAKMIEEKLNDLLCSEAPDDDLIDRCYAKLDDLDLEQAPARAGKILHGLGFTQEMQVQKSKDFSGGWRMRIALARALFIRPYILLLDEPTNHLDLESTIWLEDYLSKYDKILVMISHSQDFLNRVCTNIIHLSQQKFEYYSGDYDTFTKTRKELIDNYMKQFQRDQKDIEHMKQYIARFGHGNAKMARQAKSKQKTLDKILASDTGTMKYENEHTISFRFVPCGELPPPVLQFQDVSFGYTPDKMIYENVNLGIDLDSRIALVGPNGAGKSTFLKLITKDLVPTEGNVKTHTHLRIGRYHQHIHEEMDLNISALRFMVSQFPETSDDDMRSQIGRFGITGDFQTMPMSQLSDGVLSRVVFSWLTMQKPHMLLLDEPTNHLDIETIDALADALNAWDGGMVLVSHDFRLIDQVAQQIWICEKGGINEWVGSISEYKQELKEMVLGDL